MEAVLYAGKVFRPLKDFSLHCFFFFLHDLQGTCTKFHKDWAKQKLLRHSKSFAKNRIVTQVCTRFKAGLMWEPSLI